MKIIVVLVFIISCAVNSNAQLKLAGIFGNNAVIQQGIAAPIWGTASPNSTVIVSFANNEFKTTANEQGDWIIRMNPLKADGKSYELRVSSKNQTIIYNNVLIGEVWLASGQSNMGMSLDGVKNKEDEVVRANYPDIRFFQVNNFPFSQPLVDIPQKDWLICSPSTAKTFSAVGYFFARNLHVDRNVPVGIILAARGSTILESWMSREQLKTNPEFAEGVENFDTDTTKWNSMIKTAKQAEKNRLNISNSSMEGLNLKVNSAQFDDSSWSKTNYPLNMDNMKYQGYWGLIWMRKSIVVPLASANKEWKLILPISDENDRIYLNGKQIAESVSKMTSKTVNLSKGSLKPGVNLLAVRMMVHWGSASIGNENSSCYLLAIDGERIELNGSWSHNNKIEPPVAQSLTYYNNYNVNFNGMINPIIPYGIRGFLWYQGESNTSRYKQYLQLQKQLIEDWRVRWGLGHIPFLYVQLANYNQRSITPKTIDNWASLRDSQTALLSQSPNVAMACAIDIGDAFDIHPKNKQEVCTRLYFAAKAKAYGSTEIYSGPLFNSAKIEGNSVRISYKFSQNGLTTRNDEAVKGFAIADSSGNWFWADAKIDGREIVISSKEVSNPAKIQYAWQSNPDCNLYNVEFLPAIPFNVTIVKNDSI